MTADTVIENEKQIHTGLFMPDGRAIMREDGLDKIGFDLTRRNRNA